MLLAAILLVFSVPQNGNTVAEKNSSATASEVTVEDSSLSHPLPSAPEPKSKADEVAATGSDSVAGVNAAAVAPAATLNLTPAIEPRYSPSASMAISPEKAFIG